MASYLDFEKGIQQIDEDIANAKIKGDEHAIEILSKNLEKEIAYAFKKYTGRAISYTITDKSASEVSVRNGKYTKKLF